MQQETPQKKWWEPEVLSSLLQLLQCQLWSSNPSPNLNEIGWYNISILKKSFKDKEKCLTTSFFYRHSPRRTI